MTALPSGSPNTVAVLDADFGRSLTYRELTARVVARGEALAAADQHRPDLAFLNADQTVDSVVDYLALRHRAIPVVLLDPTRPATDMATLAERYRPALIINAREPIPGYRRRPPDDGGRNLDLRVGPPETIATGPTGEQETGKREAIEGETGEREAVAVLLATSGSTGNPRLVQLTADSLESNAADIAAALDLDESDRGLASLPLFYSYGLSILNSHLAAGATTVLTTASPIRPEFGAVLARSGPTSIPGVPHSYRMYRRVGLTEALPATVRHLTQAGGPLPTDEVLAVHRAVAAQGRRFHVMYGQTEAGPRMSTLAADDLPEHAGSVGTALRSGRFEITQPDETGRGEIVYEGPNVMLGYADRRADLGVRTHYGRLVTGDLGRLDGDGRLTVTGRIKRIAKLFGTRVNLDDVEARFGVHDGPLAAIEGDDHIVVFAERSDRVDRLEARARELARALRVPPRTIRIAAVDELPVTANGKTDYRRLHDVL